MEIIPAIMAFGQEELDEKVQEVQDLVPLVQIDIMDGTFVPKKSWPYGTNSQSPEPAQKYSADFLEILGEEGGMPFWESMDYEFDLMIQNPENTIDDWIIAGAKRVIIHAESTSSEKLSELLAQLRKRFPKDEFATVTLLEIGLAISTTTPVQSLFPHIELVDFVQCMGIEKIGFQGQPFDERVLTQVSALRKLYPGLIISIDGGVNLDTASRLAEAGANRLVVGSALFESEDKKAFLKELKNA